MPCQYDRKYLFDQCKRPHTKPTFPAMEPEPFNFKRMLDSLDEPPRKKSRPAATTNAAPAQNPQEVHVPDDDEDDDLMDEGVLEEDWDPILDSWHIYWCRRTNDYVWWTLRGRFYTDALGYGWWWAQ